MIQSAISNFFSNIVSFITTIGISDIVDITIVSFLAYQAIKFIRETRAAQLVKGIIVLLVMTQVSSWLNLYTIEYLLSNLMQLGFIALLVIFQPELRRALEKVGRTNFSALFSAEKDDVENTASEIAAAAVAMSSRRLNSTSHSSHPSG